MLRILLTLLSWFLTPFLWIAEAVSRWRTWPLALQGGSLGVVVVIAGFLGYGGFQEFNYVQNDPNFCRSCHTMETAWQLWSTSEHSNVSCHSCHEQSPLESLNLVIEYAFTHPTRVDKHASVSDDACLNCHGNGKSLSPQIVSTAGHQVHFEEQGISCLKCHSTSIHRFTPPTAICEVCHPDQQMKITAMGQNHCLDCHQFLKQASPLVVTKSGNSSSNALLPTRQTCLDCHLNLPQSNATFPADAPMQFDCSQCHQPHVSATPVVDCVSCHQDVPKKGLHAATTHSQTTCQTCHQPHQWTVTSRDTCTACHADKQDHNPGILCTNCHDFKSEAPKQQN